MSSQKIFLITILSGIGITAFLLFGAIHVITGTVIEGYIEFIFAIAILSNLIFLRMTKAIIKSSYIVLCITYIAMVFLVMTGGLYNTGVFWVYTLPLLAFFLLGKRGGILWSIFLGLTILELLLAAYMHRIVLPYSFFAMQQIIFSLGTVCVFLYVYEEAIERGQAMEELTKMEIAQRERQYRQIVETASEGIWTIDENSNIIFANKKLADMLGYTPEEIVGKPLFELMDEQGRKLAKPTITQRQRFIAEQHDFKFIRKDGNPIWTIISTSPLFDEKQQYKGTLGMITDVTIRHTTHETLILKTNQLEESQKKIERERQRYEALLESLGDGMIATGADGNIIFVNAVCESYLGLNKNDVLGKKLNIVVPIFDDAKHPVNEDNNPLTQVLLSGEPIHATNYYYMRKDGSYFSISLTITPVVLNKKVIGAIEIFRDITEEKEMDRIKSEFITLASHQLRTPPTAIRWYTEMLLDEKLTEEQHSYVENIYNSNHRMINLIDSLLNVSRLELGSFTVTLQPIEVSAVMETVLASFQRQISMNHLHISQNYEPNLPLIQADEDFIRIILKNLLLNSIKYTPDHGEITITIGTDHKQEEPGMLLITISDTGYGIPKDQQSKVFTKLFRAENVKKKDVDGTGLGLYIVKLIVEYSGGKLWFTSEENKGSTFFVTLPLTGMKEKKGTTHLI